MPMLNLLLFNCEPLISITIELLVSQIDDVCFVANLSPACPSESPEEDPSPDVVVTGGGKRLTLIEAVEACYQQFPQAKLVALIAAEEILPLYFIRQVALVGALQIDEIGTAFVPLLRAVASGATCFTQRIVTESIPQANGKTLLAMLNEKLTEREQQVLTLLVSGSDNYQISEILQLGEQTVRNLVSQIYGKLGVKSRAQLLVRLNGIGQE